MFPSKLSIKSVSQYCNVAMNDFTLQTPANLLTVSDWCS